MFIKGKKPRYVEEREEAEAIAQELGLKYVEPVPVLGYVPAGFPSEIPEDCIIEWVSLPEVPKGCFVFKAKGDSMSPTIRDGDYIVVKPVQDPELEIFSQKIVMYQDEWGEVALKRLKKKDGKYYLVPENPEYPTLEFDPERHRLLGKVLSIWRRFKLEE
ncbi:MAG: S24 family peptidase [Nanopusillaceae archaeon]